jgi:hypothetical protein
MGWQQDKEHVKNMYQFKGFIDAYNHGDYGSAIRMLRNTMNALGFQNGSKDNLLADPDNSQYEYDNSIRNLIGSIEKSIYNGSNGAMAFAFVVSLIADVYSGAGDSSNAVIWRTKLLNIIEKHPELNNADFD